MVLVYLPQRMKRALATNSNYPPQGIVGEAPIIGDFLLDKFPGAVVAYSTRRLRTGYLGDSMQVFRTSDFSSIEVGFLPDGSLDIEPLVAFVGLADGIITILYDQSGNGIDLTNPGLVSDLPRIIIAGVLQTNQVGQPAIFFDGIDDLLTSVNSLNSSPALHLFLFFVWKRDDINNFGLTFNLRFPLFTTGNRLSAIIPRNTGMITWDAGNISADRLQTPLLIYNDLLNHQFSMIKTAGTDNQKIRRDGIEIAAQTQGSSSTLTDRIIMGNARDDDILPYNMKFQEFIFYDTDQLSNMVDIEADQINFYLQQGNLVTNTGDNLVTNTGDNLVVA